MPKDAIRDLFDSVSPDASIVLKTEREIRNMIERKNENRRIPLKAAVIALAACLTVFAVELFI